MKKDLSLRVKQVIISSIGCVMPTEELTEDYRLIGNLLDSIAITNLILSLEEYFQFSFNDEELSAEAFETIGSLVKLIEGKLAG